MEHNALVNVLDMNSVQNTGNSMLKMLQLHTWHCSGFICWRNSFIETGKTFHVLNSGLPTVCSTKLHIQLQPFGQKSFVPFFSVRILTWNPSVRLIDCLCKLYNNHIIMNVTWKLTWMLWKQTVFVEVNIFFGFTSFSELLLIYNVNFIGCILQNIVNSPK